MPHFCKETAASLEAEAQAGPRRLDPGSQRPTSIQGQVSRFAHRRAYTGWRPRLPITLPGQVDTPNEARRREHCLRASSGYTGRSRAPAASGSGRR